MNEATQKRLEAGGWKFGSVEEFLGLGEEESACIEPEQDIGAALAGKPSARSSRSRKSKSSS